ncbi:MATE family efflux transporter [Mangrovibacterium marinum]|uniref:Multidrug export protein MepA n=1 Tax=Mangrovibacterium marinum TaxID=1639118 RepID=A0A2T5C4B3_9BACT|nr:MATE family efflux transporter [Mangrovibacterium marinum]PTN09649.1 putative MATE family efflux protein [Mangrovibacterium marinum]
MEKTRELGEQPVGRLMLKYFIPAFIGVFVNALYNIVDRIFIGQGVGAMALSGVSVIFPIMLVMIAFGMLIGIGASVLVSINMGRRDLDRAERVLGNSFAMMVIASVLITALGFAIKSPMLKMFGATPETIGYANDYLNIILVGVIFQVVGFSLNNVIRSEGNAKIAMYSMLISAGTNIVLDPIFIFGLDMGVKGAAYATVISMMVLAVWVLLHFNSKRSVVKIRTAYFKIEMPIIKEILVIGMAPFFMQIANSVVQALINTKLISFGGDLAVGAMGIVNSVATMIIMSIVAINMASQPIIGFNYGARAYARVQEALKLAIISATVISILAFIVVQLFPDLLVRFFNSKDPDLLAIGRQGLRLGLLALPVVGYQVVVGNFYQSIGKAKIATILTLLRQVIVLIPLLFILPSFLELDGIWISMPIADFCSALIVLFFIRREWMRLSVLDNEI